MTFRIWSILALCSIAASADTVTYNYQGAAFDRCGHGGCPANYTSDYAIAALSFGAPLAANLSLADVTSNLLSWTIGDALGYSTFSSSSTGSPQVLLSTDSNGAIVAYQVQATGGPGTDVAMFNPPTVGKGSGLLFADGIDAITDPVTKFGFAASSHLTGQWTETLGGFQGGSSSAPVFLIGGNPITAVSGTIGGNNSEEYYEFLWGGGPLSISASVTGSPASATYLLSGGGSNSCAGLGSQSLDSSNNFSGTLSLPSLAPGQYCVGLTASDLTDPDYSLKFSSAVVGTPEPGSLGLVLSAVAFIGTGRLAQRRSRRP